MFFGRGGGVYRGEPLRLTLQLGAKQQENLA